jgi:hypothetical protein
VLTRSMSWMLPTRSFALALGVLLVLLGTAGFVPALLTPLDPATSLRVPTGAGLLFGLFPVNLLADLLHLALGGWGLVAARSFVTSRAFCRSISLLLVVMALCGMITGTHVLWGMLPLYGNAVWLHALMAVLAAYFGWRPVSVTDEAGLTAAPVAE